MVGRKTRRLNLAVPLGVLESEKRWLARHGRAREAELLDADRVERALFRGLAKPAGERTLKSLKGRLSQSWEVRRKGIDISALARDMLYSSRPPAEIAVRYGVSPQLILGVRSDLNLAKPQDRNLRRLIALERYLNRPSTIVAARELAIDRRNLNTLLEEGPRGKITMKEAYKSVSRGMSIMPQTSRQALTESAARARNQPARLESITSPGFAAQHSQLGSGWFKRLPARKQRELSRIYRKIRRRKLSKAKASRLMRAFWVGIKGEARKRTLRPS